MSLPETSLHRKLSKFRTFNEEERSALESLLGDPVRFAAKTELLAEGDRDGRAYVVLDGWAFCYKEVENGGRQVVNFQLPGDFVGLRSLFLRTADHSSATLTACQLVAINRELWEEVFDRFPRIQSAVLWALAREEALVVEHLVNIGLRTADQRTANLLCELGLRLNGPHASDSNEFTCPVPQMILADALGLSVVHLNRTLRRLREDGLITIRPRGLHVPDLRKLIEHSGVEADPLH